MRTFISHLRITGLLRPLRENFYDLNHAAYDQLFATELKRLSLQAKDPKAKGHLEDMANDGTAGCVARTLAGLDARVRLLLLGVYFPR